VPGTNLSVLDELRPEGQSTIPEITYNIDERRRSGHSKSVVNPPSDERFKIKTLDFRTTIRPYVSIDLHVHRDLPPGDAEIALVIRPLANARTAPQFPSDEGDWAGKMPDTDIDADIAEMNRLWERSLELPK